jgi:hypothetical protein
MSKFENIIARVDTYLKGMESALGSIKWLSGHRMNERTGEWTIPKNAKPRLTASDCVGPAKGDKPTALYLAVRKSVAQNKSKHAKYAGFTMVQIIDEVDAAAYKLKLCDGNVGKKRTAAQVKRVAAFSNAKIKASRDLGRDMSNLRRDLNTAQGVVTPQKDGKQKTAAGKSSSTGNAAGREVESGTTPEAKGSAVPHAIQHPTLVELVNKLAQLSEVQQKTLADHVVVKGMLKALTAIK